MGLTEIFDIVIKATVGFSGVGLIGLMLVRTDARGRWKLVGLTPPTLFQPQMDRTGRMLGLIFGVCLLLAVVRTVTELWLRA